MKKLTIGLLVLFWVMPMAARAEMSAQGLADKADKAAQNTVKKLKDCTNVPVPANYGALKLGYFIPNNDENGLKDFNQTWDVELAYGRMLTKNIAAEIGGTYYSTKNDDDDVDAKVTTWSIPVTVKYIYPATKDIDIFAGAGFGYYSSKIEANDESDTGDGWGYHAVVGADYKITPDIALGMELKWNRVTAKNSDWDDNPNVGGTSAKICAKYLF